MLRPMDRRSLLLWLLSAPGLAAAGNVRPRTLRFPQDHGAHPETRIEWWYLTGWLDEASRRWGFQLTFFRAATGLGAANPSRFAPRQLVFAHAAISDLQQQRLRHDQRIARTGFGIAEAAVGDTALTLQHWSLRREAAAGASRYLARVASESAAFTLDLQLDATQPLLLQGDAGYSRKGPGPEQASHYYSEPQLAVQGRLTEDGKAHAVRGHAWLDHEWSDSLLDPQAVGWDWIGINLDDGSALTAFRLRRADGSALWAGGSFRAAGTVARDFGADDVHFASGRIWQSPASGARYPVEWQIETPAGRFMVKALLDAQELDSRASTGSIYWEGLSALFDADGRRVGTGYLELTGYAERLRL
jgi:predicted secreted hydrolase